MLHLQWKSMERETEKTASVPLIYFCRESVLSLVLSPLHPLLSSSLVLMLIKSWFHVACQPLDLLVVVFVGRTSSSVPKCLSWVVVSLISCEGRRLCNEQLKGSSVILELLLYWQSAGRDKQETWFVIWDDYQDITYPILPSDQCQHLYPVTWTLLTNDNHRKAVVFVRQTKNKKEGSPAQSCIKSHTR